MEIFELLWHATVSAALFYCVSRCLPERVRCQVPEGVLKWALTYAVAFRILFRLGVLAAALPILVVVIIPLVGPFLVVLAGLIGGFLVSAASAWLAQWPWDDVEFTEPRDAFLIAGVFTGFRVAVELLL